MAEAWLSLGANLGDPDRQLAEAVLRLHATDGIDVFARSSVLTTAPWGNLDQPDFRNMAVAIRTDLPPFALLAACKGIEASLGRTRIVHWGPRLIDIDIVCYDRLRLVTDALTLPHPFAAQREFVMTPLREIAPEAAAWLLTQPAAGPAP